MRGVLSGRIMNRKICVMIKTNMLEILVCVFIFMSLVFCITGDFNHDDLNYFYFRGREILEECSFTDIIIERQNAWIARGRFSPVALIWSYIIYYVFTDFQLYELFLIFLTILDVIFFGKLVEMLLNSKKCKLYAMFGISLFFQVYSTYHNTLTGYAGLLQISVLLTFAELIFLYQYLQNDQKKFLLFSIVFQIASVMVYEFNYFNIFLVLCVLLIRNKKIWSSFKIICVYSIPLVIVGSYSVYINFLSKQTNTIYGGSEIHFHIMKIAETLLKQLLATIPLFNFFQNKEGVLSGNLLMDLTLLDFGTLALFILIAVLIVRKFKEEQIAKIDQKVFWFALILYLSPAILPSMTTKYQDELVWGIAHIAVFEQYFGLCLLLLLSFIKVFNGFQKICKNRVYISIFKIIIFSCMFSVCIVNLAVEHRYILYLQSAVKFPKAALVHALKNDILQDMKEEDILLVPQAAPYDSSAFYSQQTGKKVHAYTLDGFRQLSESKVEESHIYVIHKYGTKELEMVLLGEVDKIKYDDLGSPVSYDVNQIKIYRNAEFSQICFEDQTVSISEMILSEDDIYSYSFQEPVNFFEITVV